MVKALHMDSDQHENNYLFTIMEAEGYGTGLSTRSHHSKKKKIADHLDDERIEVKILPQDEHWGEILPTSNGGHDETLTTINNETTIQFNESFENINHISSSAAHSSSILGFHLILSFLCFLSFISPILFLILPFIFNQMDSHDLIDYTYLLPIIFKFLFLLIGLTFFFYRRKLRHYLPRIHLQKVLFLSVLILLLLTYWLYYIFKFIKNSNLKSQAIFSFTSTYEDLLIYFFLIMICIYEMKYFYPKWIVKIVRSPDGLTKQYTIGRLSIQEASVYLLEQYYKDFPVFNPWLDNLHVHHQGTLTTKSVGSQSNSTVANRTTLNDRFYDELDYERRVRKRRTKLIASCEDAFTHVRKSVDEKTSSHLPMDSREAAQAVFSSMSRSLQKYLRITRQQPYFTRESIIFHLSLCLSHALSPRAFLERYIQPNAQPLATLLFPKLSASTEQSWFIQCDESISINHAIQSNLTVVLKQEHAEHITLICTFYPIPRLSLIERIFSSKQNRFVLKLNSETSV